MAATHPVSVPLFSHEFVGSNVETVEGLESMSVPVPATSLPVEASPLGGGPGLQGSASPLLAGIFLGCPGSQADLNTLARGQTSIAPGMEYRSEPLQSRSLHALRATAAAGDATGKAESSTQQPPARPPHATAAVEYLQYYINKSILELEQLQYTTSACKIS